MGKRIVPGKPPVPAMSAKPEKLVLSTKSTGTLALISAPYGSFDGGSTGVTGVVGSVGATGELVLEEFEQPTENRVSKIPKYKICRFNFHFLSEPLQQTQLAMEHGLRIKA